MLDINCSVRTFSIKANSHGNIQKVDVANHMYERISLVSCQDMVKCKYNKITGAVHSRLRDHFNVQICHSTCAEWHYVQQHLSCNSTQYILILMHAIYG